MPCVSIMIPTHAKLARLDAPAVFHQKEILESYYWMAEKATHLFMASPATHGEYVAQGVGKALWVKGGEPPRIFD